jgi:hypothetical protein
LFLKAREYGSRGFLSISFRAEDDPAIVVGNTDLVEKELSRA